MVTALFADVVGSTVLGERLDPEDFQATVGEGVARAVRATEALGGHVERVAGDGALVLFGAPVAHEDDAERAVLAGLRVLEAMDIYSRELVEERDLEGGSRPPRSPARCSSGPTRSISWSTPSNGASRSS